jgi:uncharacterized membrane protein YeaQ/YmgE (transglycosylase-associated protein family)
MPDLLIFALLGLLAGAAARVWYPGRQPMSVMGTMLVGMGGALLGGLISWAVWTSVEGQLHNGALLVSLLGAVVALVAWACAAYGRSISTPR